MATLFLAEAAAWVHNRNRLRHPAISLLHARNPITKYGYCKWRRNNPVLLIQDQYASDYMNLKLHCASFTVHPFIWQFQYSYESFISIIIVLYHVFVSFIEHVWIVHMYSSTFLLLPPPPDKFCHKICPEAFCIIHSHSSSLWSPSNLRAVIRLLALQQSASCICWPACRPPCWPVQPPSPPSQAPAPPQDPIS